MSRFTTNQDVIIPCPDCGTTENRDYSPFLNWLDGEESLQRLLTWVCQTPCYACQHKRHVEEKKAHSGGRPKKKA